MLLQDLGDGPVRDAMAIRQAAAGPPQRLGRLGGKHLPELPDEPRLAHARVSHDRDEMRIASAEDALEGRQQQPELRLAPDEDGGSPPPAWPCEGERADRRPGEDQFTLALRGNRRGLVELKAPRTAVAVRSPARIWPAAAACSNRAATFDASPVTNELLRALPRRSPRRC